MQLQVTLYGVPPVGKCLPYDKEYR
jgi:hypothetical protein